MLAYVKQMTVQQIKDMHSAAKNRKSPVLAKFLLEWWVTRVV